MNNDRVKYHKHCRQNQDNNDHTDDRAPRKQGTDGTDHLNLRVAGYTEGCGKETQATADDGRHTGLMRNTDSFFFVFSILNSFLFIKVTSNAVPTFIFSFC